VFGFGVALGVAFGAIIPVAVPGSVITTGGVNSIVGITDGAGEIFPIPPLVSLGSPKFL
jgi:hypothetical protein